jgi:beta-galactosidase
MSSEQEKGLSRREFLRLTAAGTVVLGMGAGLAEAAAAPAPVKAVWDLGKAYRESTATRARVCINGLWRWQPAPPEAESVPADAWGYFKVPGPWPGSGGESRDSQTVHADASWEREDWSGTTSAWYQRELVVPEAWAGRRLLLHVEYLNSYAAVFIDGKRIGEVRFPWGEVDLTSVCRPGRKHVLSLLVVALPLKGVMLSFSDTNAAKQVEGSVARRGLCGDVYLVSEPAAARLGEVKVDTSVRRGEITIHAAVRGLAAGGRHRLRARVAEGGRTVRVFTSRPFAATDLAKGRFTFTEKWLPEKLWDIHRPQHQYTLDLSLLDARGTVLDAALPVRFGYREFWIDGRDFYLNGTRIFLNAIPLDNAGMGAAWATYEAVKETLLRLKAIGTNFVYTHNYGCEPGSHLSFAEALRAADDVGMLVALSQPHFGHYEWNAPDAEQTNGYAEHAAFYVHVAGNHPSVVFYSTSHNATGYIDDENPDLIDGRHDLRPDWARNAIRPALQAEATITRLDPTRIVYHHSSGNLSAMYTLNFYLNFAPAQEVSDWFEHWATEGVKPLFTCEYAVPGQLDWTNFRGWYRGKRSFGSTPVPWEILNAEWNAQFLGPEAYRISEAEKKDLRWEATKFREGKPWYRWDYPYPSDSRAFDGRWPIYAEYLTDNCRAFRTWGLSGSNQWEYWMFWKLRQGADGSRRELRTDWDKLQRPGFSPDYINRPYDMLDQGYQRADWIPTVAAEAYLRNLGPLLAYIGGGPDRFTSKDHNSRAGETVEKQLIVINNSRETVTAECRWSLNLPQPITGSAKVTVHTGDQHREPLRLALPPALPPGRYTLTATVALSTGETQEDSFTIHVLPPARAAQVTQRIALFDPRGETARALSAMGMRCQSVDAGADLSGYDLLIVGKAALAPDGPAPDVGRVRDGLRVLMFEQTPEVLEQRFGFRVLQYGMRQVFRRVPDHPVLAGLEEEHLRDWRGEATLQPPRLKYEIGERYAPSVKWCGLDMTRLWRCGNRGNVASVLIEKPACGDFLPVVDAGFSLQYSPLLEYREGRGMLLFCQMDVTGRSEEDPAAEILARNLLQYVSAWQPTPRRLAWYVGSPEGRQHLERAGVAVTTYDGGDLGADEVLVIGSGGGAQLAPHAAAISRFVQNGGHVLALGLSESEANAFLPFRLQTQQAEHIAAFFEPFDKDSLFAGVSPADVHNRDPRELPLVTGGATVIGGGVLAQAERANVVFWQLPPYDVAPAGVRENQWVRDGLEQCSLKRTFRRTAFTLTRLLANMGVTGATPTVARFTTPVTDSASEKRWLEGLYLDQPEEWDDPYRFFGW